MSHEGVDFVVRLATAIRDKPTPKPMSEEGAGKEGDKPTSVR